jgi:hypothetical protein
MYLVLIEAKILSKTVSNNECKAAERIASKVRELES